MNRVICTTSIYPPSPALRKFAAMEGWQLVIAGDITTPHVDYNAMEVESNFKVHYLSPEKQINYDSKLSDLIGWRSIQRRNFAFLYACKELKADIVASTDDDNIPIDGWGENLMVGQKINLPCLHPLNGVLEPIGPASVGGYDDLWHRGYPLQLLNVRAYNYEHVDRAHDIQADFWNGNADVDAVCRMVNGDDPEWDLNRFPFTTDSPSPFNSQNTFLHKDVMPHYFMHLDVARFDDVLASYYVQSKGFRVVYGKPSVRQERNEHDVMKDFANEIWGYQNILQVIRDLKANPDNLFNWLTPRAAEAFRLYQKHFE